MTRTLRARAVTRLREQGASIDLLAKTLGRSRTLVGYLLARTEVDFWKAMQAENVRWARANDSYNDPSAVGLLGTEAAQQ